MAEKILAAGAGKGLAALQKKTGLTLGGDHNDKPSVSLEVAAIVVLFLTIVS